MHCTAANGGTRTSTVRPGTSSASTPRLYRTAARSAARTGGKAAALAASTAARLRRAESALGREPAPRRLAECGPLLVEGGEQPSEVRTARWHGYVG